MYTYKLFQNIIKQFYTSHCIYTHPGHTLCAKLSMWQWKYIFSLYSGNTIFSHSCTLRGKYKVLITTLLPKLISYMYFYHLAFTISWRSSIWMGRSTAGWTLSSIISYNMKKMLFQVQERPTVTFCNEQEVETGNEPSTTGYVSKYQQEKFMLVHVHWNSCNVTGIPIGKRGTVMVYRDHA